MSRPITEVAVGIIIRENQDYLLAKRPVGKPYAGYWEFPGGKIELGETTHQALVRELAEELGIQVHQSDEFGVIEHDYPHAYVRLHLHLVREWIGTPEGLENQELNWQAARGLSDYALTPLLPATISIIEMMQDKGI